MGRGELDPVFAKAAFELEPGEISEVIKSEFGYHIIQCIDRRGERIKVKHILLKPKISFAQKQIAKQRLDSIKTEYLNDTIRLFEDYAFRFSADDSRANKGLMYNEMYASTQFSREELDVNIRPYIISMKEDEVSNVIETTDKTGKKHILQITMMIIK